MYISQFILLYFNFSSSFKIIQLSQWGSIVAAYILAVFTLMQFCESGSMKNRKILYFIYRIFTSPFYILVKVIFRKDLGQILRNFNEKVNNGRTYIITIFYYILYVSSLGFVVKTTISDIKIVFPKVDENKSVHWAIFQTEISPLDIVQPYLMYLMIANHLASFISFSIALARDANYPKDHDRKNKNNYYDEMLYLSTSKCNQCNTLKPSRASHCDNCQKCIQRRDHHCIWINQCVGRRNLLWFNIFLLSTGLACLFEAIISFLTIKYALCNLPNDELNTYGLVFLHHILPVKFLFRWGFVSFPLLIASFLMHILISAMLLPFSFSHLKQILTNETSIEKSKKSYMKYGIKQNKMFLYRSQDGKLRLSEQKLEKIEEHICSGDECKKIVFELVENKKNAIKYLNRYRPYDQGLIRNIIEVVIDAIK